MNIRWLYFEVHGVMPPRRAPRRARFSRGPARNWKYRQWVRSLECLCCGSMEHVEAAHTGSDGGASQKSSDYSCAPLCSDCHQFAAYSYHRDRAECERRIFERIHMTIPEVVKMLNQEWRAGRAEAA